MHFFRPTKVLSSVKPWALPQGHLLLIRQMGMRDFFFFYDAVSNLSTLRRHLSSFFGTKAHMNEQLPCSRKWSLPPRLDPRKRLT